MLCLGYSLRIKISIFIIVVVFFTSILIILLYNHKITHSINIYLAVLLHSNVFFRVLNDIFNNYNKLIHLKQNSNFPLFKLSNKVFQYCTVKIYFSA